jgi:TolB-like protein
MISLGFTYRTQDGKQVRGLSYQWTDQRTLLNGDIRKTGARVRILMGEVKIDNEWRSHVWNEDGADPFLVNDFDLVKHEPREIKQPKLF